MKVNIQSVSGNRGNKENKKPRAGARRNTAARAARVPCRVVGIGASAGGLDALERFLGRVPPRSGLAFVIIQHLDPTHKGMLAELLQHVTGMKVVQVRDRTQVRPDCVYVIPPNKDMSILRGMLYLLAPTAPRGLRLPINVFLRSLAQDQRERSIGVILSGMGTDGTLGLRAIKEKAGVVLVQEPATAKFDGMPRSAIDAGLADIVAPADELPAKLIALLQRAPPLAQTKMAMGDNMQNALGKVLVLLRAHTGHDFSLYKSNTLYRRIERRMGIHQIGKLANYVRYLEENSQEMDLLFKELLIGVTNFFRDPDAWQQLRDQALPELLANRASGQSLRAWVPGCSTGEEVYSLAITFKEAMDKCRPRENCALQIFGTDLDHDAIDKARQGLYSSAIAADVSDERLKRFFIKEKHGYRMSKEIREMVIFAPQNLIMDAPFTKLDILCCRNLLIYLTTEIQRKLVPLFHYSLKPGGILFLGSSETIGNCPGLFASLNAKSRLFRRLEAGSSPKAVEFPSSFTSGLAVGTESHPTPKATASFQSMADQLILQRYAPASVIANDTGDILYISGRTGNYLEPAAGKANWNLFAMLREGLLYELSAAFQKAFRQKAPVALHGLTVRAGGGEQGVDVMVQRLDEDGPLQGLMMIVFTPVAAETRAAARPEKTQSRSARPAELERELLQVRAEARTTHEEMQTAQEEFRSANEELQSTNEEMQSANEELMTSKEEMQSLNEELQTVNVELQSKVDELSRVSNDMKNLLDSTEIATLFLDNDLNVRRFTPHTAKIIKLIPTDVGRPVTDLVSDLHYAALPADAHKVLLSQTSIEQAISAQDGRWFTVRIMPYRTLDDRIDGVVITFSDITVSKTLEATLRARQTCLQRKRISPPSPDGPPREAGEAVTGKQPLLKKERHAKKTAPTPP